MKKPDILFFILGLFPTASFGACEILDTSERLAANPVYYRFQQSRDVPGLSRQLRSSGIIWMSDNDELVWQVQTPIKSTTVISSSGVREYNRNDQLQPALDVEIATSLSDVLLQIVRGNFTALNDYFQQTIQCEETAWDINLQPTNERFSDFFASMQLSGNDELESIIYEEVRGDVTSIQLTPVESGEPVDFEVYLAD